MINSIRSTVGTTCSAGVGVTPASQAALGIAFAKTNYAAAVASYEVGGTNILLNSIKFEINAPRPVLVGIANATSGHAVVAWGYSSDTASRMIRVNYGSGRTRTVTQPGGTPQVGNSADINVDSVSLAFAGTGTPGTVTSITRIKPGG